MKNEQAQFAERLGAALAAAGLDASPAELVKLIARHGGTPVTPQAISGWLNGKHLPKQANLRALGRLLGMEPQELQFGGKPVPAVREDAGTWVPGLTGVDTLAVREFVGLPSARRRLVRELIAALAESAPHRRSRTD